ncbi:MAG: hypothetical protein AB1454_11310 [Candidatus Auribacterota bacterium]
MNKEKTHLDDNFEEYIGSVHSETLKRLLSQEASNESRKEPKRTTKFFNRKK